MDDFRIRGAAKGDVAALAHLMSELGYPTSPGEMRHRLEEISAHPSYCALVAERDGRVLGMVGLHEPSSRDHTDTTLEVARDLAEIASHIG
jgi:hypothetical protein